MLTGLTRDGLWWVEKGRIQYPVRNLRFNQSVLAMLAPWNVRGDRRAGTAVAVDGAGAASCPDSPSRRSRTRFSARVPSVYCGRNKAACAQAAPLLPCGHF